MLHLGQKDGPKPKCYFTNIKLPNFVNHEQPPSKKRPFSTVLNQTFSHTLEVLLPEDAAQNLLRDLAKDKGKLRYAKVHMKLGEIIEGDFFNQYIKIGNITMISEGRPGVDHTFTLSEGLLRLEVDKPTFEKLGLPGHNIPSEGRKHIKVRYAIELNLRLPSMVRGKNGFDRVMWAFRNVLNDTVTWLFSDLKPASDGPGPIATHQPVLLELEPAVETLENVSVPVFSHNLMEEDYETAAETLEWLSMAMIASPQIQAHDTIDSYLSRYQVPELVDGEAPTTQKLIKVSWHGFIPPPFAHKIVLAALRASGSQWAAVSVSSFTSQAYTILFTNYQSLLWEYHD